MYEIDEGKVDVILTVVAGILFVFVVVLFGSWIGENDNKPRIEQLNQQLKTAKRNEQAAINRLAELDRKYKAAIGTIEELRTSNQKSVVELSKLAGNVESATSRAAISAKLIKECERILGTIESGN